MSWDQIVDEARGVLEGMHKARESALSQSRLLIQTSSKCIRHVHRKQYAEAEKLLQDARNIAAKARQDAGGYPEILYAGYIQDGEKEMVEAAAVLAITQGRPVPSHTELGVQVPSYLNGMGEAASEVRRFLLDEMRAGRFDVAERILREMEQIYDDLITFDFPDGLTGGLRRTCDAVRAVIERTRSDLTMTLSQIDLLTELKKYNASRNE
jgi:translin